MNKYLREPVNGLTHLIGAILSLIGFIAMIIKVISTNGSPIEYLAICLFGFGMILLYSASATYHSVISSDEAKKARPFNDFYAYFRFLCSILLSCSS